MSRSLLTPTTLQYQTKKHPKLPSMIIRMVPRLKEISTGHNYCLISIITNLRVVCTHYNILPGNIYNINEAGVILGIATSNKIIRHKGN